MSISGFNFAGSKFNCMSTVCFIANTPMLAMFWRISIGCRFSSICAAPMKIDHSRRLKSSAVSRSLPGLAQFDWTSFSCRAAYSSPRALILRGEDVVGEVARRLGLRWTFTNLDGMVRGPWALKPLNFDPYPCPVVCLAPVINCADEPVEIHILITMPAIGSRRIKIVALFLFGDIFFARRVFILRAKRKTAGFPPPP